jgi:hypothetical protein
MYRERERERETERVCVKERETCRDSDRQTDTGSVTEMRAWGETRHESLW